MTEAFHRAAFADLEVATLYAMLRLRSAVFVVEQACVYLDLDGRDTEPATVHCWAERDGAVVACLRVLADQPGCVVGRVVTDPAARRTGVGGRLMRETLSWCPRPVRINAQSRLESWYAGHGFVVSGEQFLEDDIVHTPMTLT